MRTSRFLIAATVLAGALPASASTIFFDGPGTCRQITSGTIDLVFSDIGVTANSSSAIVMNCPVDWTGDTKALNGAEIATIYYIDNNSTDSISCTPYVVNANGSTTAGATMYSCSTAGGCTSASASYTGTNYLTLPTVTTAGSDAFAYTIQCSLAPISSTNMFSYVFGVQMQQP